MDDLTRCLYEFLLERRMGHMREDEEYKACSAELLLQEERVRAGLNGEQMDELDRFIDFILEQDSMEKEHLFRATLDLLQELNGLVRA